VYGHLTSNNGLNSAIDVGQALSGIIEFGVSAGMTWTNGINGGTRDTSLNRVSAGVLQIGGSTFGAAGNLLLTPGPTTAGDVGVCWQSGNALTQGNPCNSTRYSAAGTALPTCNSGSIGMRLIVSDATLPTYLGTYTSGGATTAPVFCNGSSWLTD
jgi:hypothetical protein